MRDGLPRRSIISFTGNPIELKDATTWVPLGDYIGIYHISLALALPRRSGIPGL